jgi:hypothetical protein
MHAGSAPRGALLYPRHNREEFGGTFLGLMANLDPKGEGDNSMPSDNGHREGVEGGSLSDPRDMAKAGLPKAQSPAGKTCGPAGKTPETGAASCVGMNPEAGATSRMRGDTQRGH